jgi:hypothetical protein
MRFVPVVCLVLAVLTAAPRSGQAAENRQRAVAADGSAPFKSIQAALDSVTDATRERPVEILVAPGNYFETFTMKDWVNVSGTDRDRCVVTYSRRPDEPNHKAHVVWATSNSTIRNLTLVGRDVKYCVHSDGGQAYVLTIENCVFRREYPPDLRTIRAGFGIGLRGDQHIVMRDCVLTTDLGIYFHNTSDQPSSCSFTVERCDLRARDEAIMLWNFGSRQRDFFIIRDSRLQGGKAAVLYRNIDRTEPRPVRGASEIELFGAGNTIAGEVIGAKIADDSGERWNGVERAAKVGTRRPVTRPRIQSRLPASN